jgi:hypothetical protein
MSDTAPDNIIADTAPPRRDRRILVTALVSVALHLLLIGWLLLPRLPFPEAAEPPAIAVELVPASSSADPSSSEAPSSQPSSAQEEASSSQQASSAEPSSAAASSSPPASSAEASSASAAASSGASSSAAASEPPSAAASSPPPAPRSRPLVIPLGPSEASSDTASSAEDDTSSAAGEESSASAEAAPSDEAAAAPPITGPLHTARRFYLAALLSSPSLARVRDSIKKLPPEKRLAQSCNLEAVGQIGNAGRGFSPGALVADVFAKPAIAGTSFTVTGGAFRSQGKWYALAYDCTLTTDLSAVKSFSYRIGGDVTAAVKDKVGE